MYTKIMVPIDLAHTDRLAKAIDTASALARSFGATVTYAAVTANAPGALGHTPAEFEARLKAFADGQGQTHDHPVATHVVVSNDPAAELDAELLQAVDETGADLVVMASHIPGVVDHFWPSHGGAMARQAHVSVMLVR